MLIYKERAKRSIHIIVLLVIGGIFSLIGSIILGYIGFAVIAFLGLLACSSVAIMIFPFLKKDGDS